MKSSRRGKEGVEVTEIGDQGIELLLDSRKVFMSYKEFPWFKGAATSKVFNVRRPHPGHLRWPELDIDLEEDSIFHPERYPVMFDPSPEGGAGPFGKDRKKSR